MKQLARITIVEAKLFFREPAAWIVSLLLPTAILVVLGAIPGLREPSDAFGGERFIDLFAPSLLVLTLAMLAVNAMPIRLATYREKGVLRRLSTTPVRPAKLLVAQLVLNFAMAVASAVILVTVARLVFDVPLPQDPVGFVVAFCLGMAALLALGTLVAAVAPTARTGTGLALPLFFVAMFFGGVYVPRFVLPDFLARIGDYTPPGVQALLDTWTGTPPELAQLGTMVVIALVAGVTATKLFRWE